MILKMILEFDSDFSRVLFYKDKMIEMKLFLKLINQ